MKRGVSILLLFCFFLYHFGYYVFYFAYQHYLEAQWRQNITLEETDNHSVLEIPMRIPYLIDNKDFHETNIPFVLEGVAYRGIKKRFVNDAFQLVYVPDHAKIKLDLTLRSWVMSLVPNEAQDPSKEVMITSSFIKDYLPPQPPFSFDRLPVGDTIDNSLFLTSFKYIDLEVTSPPPKS
ncbi:hypothetical protein ADIS_1740 [Lunatimonas lonarensis]|uniref:Uncharacterized protein n=1 Tax=Lunatimonas lonarensis TaxID=1232681 RepID=R7ZUJ1_9BACT|nr:hypothetical protein [Lunatimonas lonarensis]EON77821.1 hypothetical protein ADIS_1740 [Lunatimonas lonarensis]